MASLNEYLGPWTNAEASHLLRRAGFGGTQQDRAAAASMGMHATVDALVDFEADDPYLDQPAVAGTGGIGSPLAALPDDTSELGEIKRGQAARHLQAHILYRMRYTSQPFQEQWAFFLHGHFVNEYKGKVQKTILASINAGNDGSRSGQVCTTGTLAPDPRRRFRTAYDLLRRQYYMFRQEGLDSFRDMMLKVTRDPGMLLYLDNFSNRKGRAQENYAREMMELFSMGIDNYSEADIQEIAKCLTGETLPRRGCEFDFDYETYGFDPDMHEPGSKFVFGQTIPESFTGQETEDVIDLVMNRVSINPVVSGLPSPYNTLPASALFVSWKILRWFVHHDVQLYPVPDDIVLELAEYIRGTDNGVYPQRRYPFDMKAVMRKLFCSELFYDASNRYGMIKNPVDFVISALRSLNLWEQFVRFDGPTEFTKAAGMELYEAPNVSGWVDGPAWLNSSSMIARFNYGRRLAFRILNMNVFPDETLTYLQSLLSVNGGPLSSYTDHETMVDHFVDALIHDTPTMDERSVLMSYLNGFPFMSSEENTYFNKVSNFIHLLLTMPRFQVK